jgi:hypothetical protein
VSHSSQTVRGTFGRDVWWKVRDSTLLIEGGCYVMLSGEDWCSVVWKKVEKKNTEKKEKEKKKMKHKNK